MVAGQATEEWIGARDRAVLLLLYGAGLRIAEALSLKGSALPLGEVLSAHVDTIERLTLAAEADPSREPAAIRERLAAQVKLLLEASPGFDEQRLTSEAALLATKADIREEIDRLKTHVASARSLQELLGHASLGSTQIYTKVDAATLLDVYRSAHPREQ